MNKFPLTKKRVLNAAKRVLINADNFRDMAKTIRRSFGCCPAFHDKNWAAYYLEEAMEIFLFELLKEEYQLRNGRRSCFKESKDD